MKRALSFFLASFFLLSACAQKSASVPQLKITQVWSRPAHAGADSGGKSLGTGVVYLTIENSGAADKLLSVKTDVCDSAELHESKMQDGRMTMQMVRDGLAVPAQATVALEPGGYHIMLIGLRRDLQPGDTFDLILNFEKSGAVTVQSHVKNP